MQEDSWKCHEEKTSFVVTDKHSRLVDFSEEIVESFACASLLKNSAINGKWAMRNLVMVV